MECCLTKDHLEEELANGLKAIQGLVRLGQRFGVADILQDNGLRTLELCLRIGLKILPGRAGNDAIDTLGQQWELKTANVNVKGFCTNHHLTYDILQKYREAWWGFGIFDGNRLLEVWKLSNIDMEPMFVSWETQLKIKKKDLNNPKIPFRFVRAFGTRVIFTTAWSE